MQMTERQQENARRLLRMGFVRIYGALLSKLERKGRTRAELDQAICWLTGYGEDSLAEALADGRDMESFFARAPAMNPVRALIIGTICGVRIEELEDPLMRDIRYLDKLVDELAKGRPMEKVLRG